MLLKNFIIVERPEEGHLQRPYRWSDLDLILLPLAPWIAIVIVIYFVVRLLW